MTEVGLRIQEEALELSSPTEVFPEVREESPEDCIIVACELIADAKVAVFQMTCCGDRPWPVDMTDLSIFLIQVRDLLVSIMSGSGSFEIQMYEQTTQAILTFTRKGQALEVHCSPMGPTSGASKFATEDDIVLVGAFVLMIRQVVDAFVSCCERVCPYLLGAPGMSEWVREVRRGIEGNLAASGTPA